jgi:phosphoglycolate phosphatase-like HAD superfamily hydrolase
MIRLALFDIDGTLIHSRGAGVKSFACALESEFGVRDVAGRVSFAGRTDTSLVRELFQAGGIPHTPENVRRFFDCYVFWLDHLLHQTQGQICPGVHNFIQALMRLPHPPALGLLTGNIRLGAEIKLRHFQIWEPFQIGAFADDHEDRNQIAAAARTRGRQILGDDLRDDQVLVIGDTPHDIRCGRAINAKVLAVATGGANRDQLAAHNPDWLVSDLGQFDTTALSA